MGPRPAGKDRAGLRAGRASLSFRAGGNDPVLRTTEGRPVIRLPLLELALACSPACAQGIDPLDVPKQWPDGPLKDFFQNLMRPDNDARLQFDERNPPSCCGAAMLSTPSSKLN